MALMSTKQITFIEDLFGSSYQAGKYEQKGQLWVVWCFDLPLDSHQSIGEKWVLKGSERAFFFNLVSINSS